MKIIPITYTFDASAKTIVCTDFTAIEKLALITNLTTGDIIYQFNNVLKNGVITGNILTLSYDTTSMSDTDDLQIIMEKDINPATSENQEMLIALTEMNIYLKNLLSTIQMPRNADPANNADQVVVVNTINANVATITTLTNLQQLNGEQAHLMSVASEINAWANTQRSTIS